MGCAMNAAPSARARRVIARSRGAHAGDEALELLTGCLALQHRPEALPVVVMLPAADGAGGVLESGEGLPAPELLAVDAMAALHFPVLLGQRGLM